MATNSFSKSYQNNGGYNLVDASDTFGDNLDNMDSPAGELVLSGASRRQGKPIIL